MPNSNLYRSTTATFTTWTVVVGGWKSSVTVTAEASVNKVLKTTNDYPNMTIRSTINDDEIKLTATYTGEDKPGGVNVKVDYLLSILLENKYKVKGSDIATKYININTGDYFSYLSDNYLLNLTKYKVNNTPIEKYFYSFSENNTRSYCTPVITGYNIVSEATSSITNNIKLHPIGQLPIGFNIEIKSLKNEISTNGDLKDICGNILCAFTTTNKYKIKAISIENNDKCFSQTINSEIIIKKEVGLTDEQPKKEITYLQIGNLFFTAQENYTGKIYNRLLVTLTENSYPYFAKLGKIPDNLVGLMWGGGGMGYNDALLTSNRATGGGGGSAIFVIDFTKNYTTFTCTLGCGSDDGSSETRGSFLSYTSLNYLATYNGKDGKKGTPGSGGICAPINTGDVINVIQTLTGGQNDMDTSIGNMTRAYKNTSLILNEESPNTISPTVINSLDIDKVKSDLYAGGLSLGYGSYYDNGAIETRGYHFSTFGAGGGAGNTGFESPETWYAGANGGVIFFAPLKISEIDK